MKPDPIHWQLVLLKVTIVCGALWLDLSGRLSPQLAPIILTLVGALGLAHVASVLKRPPPSPEMMSQIASVVFQVIDELRPPAPASSSSSPVTSPSGVPRPSSSSSPPATTGGG